LRERDNCAQAEMTDRCDRTPSRTAGIVTGDAAIAMVIPCSKRKIACSLPGATAQELANDREAVHRRLAPYARPARDLYVGRQHRAMVSAIDSLRFARPDLTIGLHIVSAGYGLLGEHDVVVPYDAALGTTPTSWRAAGARLRLHADLCGSIAGARFTLVCLSAAYLSAAGAPFDCGGCPIYLAASSAQLGPSALVIPAGRAEARRFGVPEREVRAAVLRELCARIADSGLAPLEAMSPGRRSPAQGAR
jgi:hypothetical protein